MNKFLWGIYNSKITRPQSIFLTLVNIVKQFSKLFVPIYTPTSNIIKVSVTIHPHQLLIAPVFFPSVILVTHNGKHYRFNLHFCNDNRRTFNLGGLLCEVLLDFFAIFLSGLSIFPLLLQIIFFKYSGYEFFIGCMYCKYFSSYILNLIFLLFQQCCFLFFRKILISLQSNLFFSFSFTFMYFRIMKMFYFFPV